MSAPGKDRSSANSAEYKKRDDLESLKTMPIKPLPPLNTLQAFEASARHLSFTAAATELNITQSAISRKMKLLETSLGKALFQRGKTGIRLTPSGERYYRVVLDALSQIADETRELMKWSGDNQITVACSLTVANYWLAPRLSLLQKSHPQLQIRVLCVENFNELDPTAFDVAIYYCLEQPSTLSCVSVFEESVVAICSPSYLQNHAPIHSVPDLLNHNLLLVEEHHNDWLTWQDWFEQLGYSYHKPERVMKINNFALIMNATMLGQGIALGWRRLLQEYLDQGLLVQALPECIPSRGTLTLMHPSDRLKSPAAKLFVQWILASVDE